MSEKDVVDVLSDLQALFDWSFDEDGFLNDVAALAVRLDPRLSSCGITIPRQRQPVTAASSDDLARNVEAVQYREDAGPCLSTLREGIAVDVPDLTKEDRWAAYRARGLECGVRSSLSLPLKTEGETMASLNLYSGQPDGFSGDKRWPFEAFAGQAARAFAAVTRHNEQTKTIEDLQQALASRSVIDLAVGVLMEQQGATPAAALETLRSLSRTTNRDLLSVAAEVGSQASAPVTPQVSAVTPRDDVVGFRLSGEFDLESRRVLHSALTEGLNRAGRAVSDLHLDVADMDYVDVGATRLLVRVADALKRSGRRLVLDAPQPELLRLLDVGWGGLEQNNMVLGSPR